MYSSTQIAKSREALTLFFALWIVALTATSAHAQHGDYLLGTMAFWAESSPPKASIIPTYGLTITPQVTPFFEEGFTRCGPVSHRVCGTLNLSSQANGSLDLFVDQNIFGWTTPLTLLGAHYGFLIDIPFAIADANGAASLEPTLALRRFTIPLSPIQGSGGSTKGNLGDIYVEPVNLGWHFRHLDAVVSSGFMTPAGAYNSDELLNIGFGHWSGMFGLGGIFYPDAEHTWSASVYAHYMLYGSQMGRNYTLGDEVPFEWGLGKSFSLPGTVFQQLTLGPVGYAQWQVTNNAINFSPTSKIQAAAISTLEKTRSETYAAGPAASLLTSFGLFSLRWYEEFGAHATPPASS